MTGGSKVLLAIISVPLLVLLHGYTVQTLWAWFIVPHFGVSSLPFVTALGIGLLVSYLTMHFQHAESEEFWGRFTYMWLRAPMALLAGYIYLAIFGAQAS